MRMASPCAACRFATCKFPNLKKKFLGPPPLPNPGDAPVDRVPSEMFFKFCDASDDMRQTRGHNWKIFKPQHTLDVRKHTFSVRIINDWNSLSAEVVNAESLKYIQKQIGQVVGPGYVQKP